MCLREPLQLCPDSFDRIKFGMELRQKARDEWVLNQHMFYHALLVLEIGMFSQSFAHPVPRFPHS